MDKRDTFETRIAEQLRRAEAPVPGAMWSRIRDAVQGGGAEAGVSTASWWVGGVAAVVLLGSLAWYGAVRPVTVSEAPTPHVVVSQPNETNTPVEHSSTTAEVAEESVEAVTTAKAADYEEEPRVASAAPVVSSAEVSDAETTSSPATTENIAADEPKREATTETEDEATTKEMPVRVSRPTVLADTETNESEAENSQESEPADRSAAQRLDFRMVAGDTRGYAPHTVELRAEGNADSYYWDLGAGGTVTGPTAKVTFQEPGTYTVYLVATTSDGATRSKAKTFDIREGSNLVVPDSFTPNGDGINDTYRVSGVGIESYRLSIVDSKGRVVFETQNMDEEWDAQSEGHPRVGEYYRVVVQAIGEDGQRYAVTKRLNIIH